MQMHSIENEFMNLEVLSIFDVGKRVPPLVSRGCTAQEKAERT